MIWQMMLTMLHSNGQLRTERGGDTRNVKNLLCSRRLLMMMISKSPYVMDPTEVLCNSSSVRQHIHQPSAIILIKKLSFQTTISIHVPHFEMFDIW